MSTSMSLDYSKLYRLRDPLASRPLRLDTRDPGVSQEQASLLARGRLKLLQPLWLGAYMGGQLADFLWTGFPPLFCVSQRVVELLRENGVTGWDTYLVEVYGRKGEPLSGYHGFAVTGSECKRDRSRSQIIDKPPPVPGGRGYQVYRGLYFDESQWDGSDMFWVRGIIVTEKVFRLLRKAKVSNVRLTPLLEVEIDVMLDKYDKQL